MKLGILVNTDKHLFDVIHIIKTAVLRDHEVIVFTMDEGTKLLEKPEYQDLCKFKKVTMSFCDHNAKMFDVHSDVIPDEIVCGSQFDNAVMHHECDKIIVL
jgi:predicted peroxiredoxin